MPDQWNTDLNGTLKRLFPTSPNTVLVSNRPQPFSRSQCDFISDDEHSENEERWITLGISNSGGLLVVSHTFTEAGESVMMIRIISSRKANRHEQRQYHS